MVDDADVDDVVDADLHVVENSASDDKPGNQAKSHVSKLPHAGDVWGEFAVKVPWTTGTQPPQRNINSFHATWP